MKYEITMNNGDIWVMTIVAEDATVEGEIAKWPTHDNEGNILPTAVSWKSV